jgi:hypothetical protein
MNLMRQSEIVVVARGAGRGVAVVEFIEVGWKFISR